MTLTNYWWLLIWMFVGGGILAYLFPKKQEVVFGIREERWGVVPAIILATPLIIWSGFRDGNVFGDTISYQEMFDAAPGTLSQLGAYINEATKDKGFSALIVIFKCIFGNNCTLFFVMIAAFQILCVTLVFRKYSCDFWLSMFIFVASTDYLSWTHNGIRQFIAVALIFAASELLYKKKYVPLIVIILLVSTIHGSALLMIPIIFIVQGKAWNKKTLLLVGAAVLALLFVDQFTDILDTLLSDTQYTNVVSDWESWNDNGTSPIRVLVYSVPAIMSLVGMKYIRRSDDIVMNVSTNASIVTMALAIISMGTSGIFMGRLPIFVEL